MAHLDPRRAAYLVAAVIAAALGYDLMHMPVQVSDSLSLLLDAQQAPSLYATFVEEATRGTYIRPLFHVQVNMLVDLSQGHYWLFLRGFHALLIAAVLLLFTRAMRVRTWVDFAAAVFALTVLTGLHTFRGTVREAFVINHFLEMVVLCLVALNLTRSRGGGWIDAAAIATFIVASLTMELGLLVWVIVAAAWLCGMRGVSGRGVTAMTALLGAYFVVRFAVIDAQIEARSSGFLLEMLEFREIQDRFGANPLGFYLYNVVTSMMSILFSDPDGGVFEIARTWLRGDVPPRLYVAVTSSILTTVVVLWVAGRAWRLRDVPRDDVRMLFLAAAVLVANAALSFAYTKHEIITVAGVFYALASFVAARYTIEFVWRSRRGMAPVVACLVLALAAGIWAFRSAGVHHMMRVQAFKERNDWARISMERVRELGLPHDERAEALVARLRHDALEMRVPNPNLLPRWADRWWGE